jgi:hypothetical protein
MFWDIADEGMVPSGSTKEMWMASGLNAFLHTRPQESNDTLEVDSKFQ